MFSFRRARLGEQKEQSFSSVASLPYQRSFVTAMGPVLLCDNCSFAFVQRLTIDDGMRSFTRRAEREYALLLELTRRENCSLALAYTPEGTIVGQLTLAPADNWWQGVPHTYEVAFEVSANWRRQGVARQLIELVKAQKPLEDKIILGLGLSWHWDIESIGLLPLQYRAMLAALVRPYGFAEYLTSEPNIREDPANILLVRCGQNVDQQTLNNFLNCLFRSDTLPGL